MNGNEVRKYNPANITPEHLFRPPTVVARPELVYLVSQLNKTLEGKGLFKDNRILLVGTELEVLFFSPDGDPALILKQFKDSDTNPNYSPNHGSKMDKMDEFSRKLCIEKPDEYQFSSRQSRVFFEFRTAPQSVSEHLVTVDRFSDMLREKCRELEVLPVVHSQHLHVSLRNNPSKSIYRYVINNEGGFIINQAHKGKDLFVDVNPLVLLPEEWNTYHRARSHTFKSKRGNGRTISGIHTEFRKLSSEYACDPVLNLLLSLRAMEEGIFHHEPRGKFVSFQCEDSYELATEQMRKNKDLAKFFGRSTLDTLSNIAAQYPAVSRREITVDQIK